MFHELCGGARVTRLELEQGSASLNAGKTPRVILRLGELTHMNPKVIEGLFSADLAFLQSFYRRINEVGDSRLPVTCPRCETSFSVEADRPGE